MNTERLRLEMSNTEKLAALKNKRKRLDREIFRLDYEISKLYSSSYSSSFFARKKKYDQKILITQDELVDLLDQSILLSIEINKLEFEPSNGEVFLKEKTDIKNTVDKQHKKNQLNPISNSPQISNLYDKIDNNIKQDTIINVKELAKLPTDVQMDELHSPLKIKPAYEEQQGNKEYQTQRPSANHNVTKKGGLYMNYDYRMVQIPPSISMKAKDARGQEAAQYLQQIVNENAVNGWEFYRVDQVGVQIKPGCLARLLGATIQNLVYYVVTFRKPE